MAVKSGRFPRLTFTDGAIGGGILSGLAVAFGAGVVALFAAGRMPLSQAGLLIAIPVVLALAVLRPEWTILLLVVLPPSVTPPPMQMAAVTIVALFGFLLQGRLHLGIKTGVYPLAGLVALALAVKAGNLSPDSAAASDGMFKLLIYYTLLMVVAYNSVANGRIRIDTFINVFLFGLLVAAVLEPFLGDSSGFGAITHTPFRGKFAYLAVMGFGVAYARLSLSASLQLRRSHPDVALMIVFLFLAAIGFSRAAWIAGLWIFALVSLWTRRNSFWIVAALSLLLVFTVPVIGERVLPEGSTDLSDPNAIARLTTGRSALWERLWERAIEGLPLGQGWGHITSLDSIDIFGAEVFPSAGSNFVFPHNDFLWVFVDLGLPGLGLLLIHWLYLLQRIRHLSRGNKARSRYSVRVLVPVVIVMFVVQMFDNGLAIRFVATRFFIAAGLILGLRYLDRQDQETSAHGEPSLVLASSARA